MFGELGADRDALARVEPVERALGDMGADARQAPQVPFADAAHENAGRAERRRGEGLAFDQRQRQRHAGNLGDAARHRVVVGERRVDALQEHVAVEADHLLHQIVAKAVHHRHHHDQRGDAEHDAEEGEAGDHRNRPLRAPRAQIAQRHHPLEGGERSRRERRRGERGRGVDGSGGHTTVTGAANPPRPSPCLSPHCGERSARRLSSPLPALSGERQGEGLR